jgi:putative aldouronate transport system substrate-binding protein
MTWRTGKGFCCMALILLLALGAGGVWGAAKKTPAGAKVSAKPIKVSIFLQDRPESVISNDLPVIKEITARTNVSFNFIPGPATDDQCREKLNIIVASGDVPDIVTVTNFGMNDMQSYADRGLFTQLNSLIASNAPNLKKILKERPAVAKGIKANNGKTYFFPMIGAVKTSKLFMIRKDWLRKLGLKEPKTLDDWYTVLKAFKEKNPAGNGRKVYPFTTRNNLAGLLVFMEVYGMSGFEVDEQFYTDKAGKVQYAYIKPDFKKVLTFLNKLYKEELIDPEYPTNSKPVWLSKMSNGTCGATVDWFTNITPINNMGKNSGDTGIEVAMIPPPVGPSGIQMTTAQQKTVRGFTGISAKSKYKTEITRLFDYFYSPAGNLLMNFGIARKHYNLIGGKPVFTVAMVKDPGGKSVLQMLFTIGHREWAYKQDINYENQLLTDEASKKARDEYVKYIKPAFPILPYTPDERNTINAKYIEIQTYKDEMVNKFITGQEPLDKFDEFVRKINAMGINDVLKIQQNAYNRYSK